MKSNNFHFLLNVISGKYWKNVHDAIKLFRATVILLTYL